MTKTLSALHGISKAEYHEIVKRLFLARKCTKIRISTEDSEQIGNWFRMGRMLELIESAIYLGCCRKYRSWIEDGDRNRINSLSHFDPTVIEIGGNFMSGYYRLYLLDKLWEIEQMIK